MDRLTTRNPDGTIGVGHPLRYYNHEDIVQVLNRLAAYEDTGLEPEELALCCRMMCDISISHFHELLKAEEEQRLYMPPCKVGDTVYEPRPDRGNLISEYTVISIHISACSVLVGWILEDGICSNLNGFEISALGKTVFLTREEAEAALKGGKQDGAD